MQRRLASTFFAAAAVIFALSSSSTVVIHPCEALKTTENERAAQLKLGRNHQQQRIRERHSPADRVRLTEDSFWKKRGVENVNADVHKQVVENKEVVVAKPILEEEKSAGMTEINELEIIEEEDKTNMFEDDKLFYERYLGSSSSRSSSSSSSSRSRSRSRSRQSGPDEAVSPIPSENDGNGEKTDGLEPEDEARGVSNATNLTLAISPSPTTTLSPTPAPVPSTKEPTTGGGDGDGRFGDGEVEDDEEDTTTTLVCPGKNFSEAVNEDTGPNTRSLVEVRYTYEADVRGGSQTDGILRSLEDGIITSMRDLLNCARIKRREERRMRAMGRRLDVVAIVASDKASDAGKCKPRAQSANMCLKKTTGFDLIIDEQGVAARERARERALDLIEKKMNAGEYDDLHPRLVDVRYVDESSASKELDEPEVIKAVDDQAGGSKKVNAAVWVVVSLAFVAVAVVLERVRRRRWGAKSAGGPDDDAASDLSSDELAKPTGRGAGSMSSEDGIKGLSPPVAGQSAATLPVESEKTLAVSMSEGPTDDERSFSATSESDRSDLDDEENGMYGGDALPPLSQRSLDDGTFPSLEDGHEDEFVGGGQQSAPSTPPSRTSTPPSSTRVIIEDEDRAEL